ncbi:unnamed protein product [Linum trigynum]|uniref:Uncharacterized protein n=1 Tax=Linum trigynum TaxID=586398 RepID=A0AAV2DA42_9ROSI
MLGRKGKTLISSVNQPPTLAASNSQGNSKQPPTLAAFVAFVASCAGDSSVSCAGILQHRRPAVPASTSIAVLDLDNRLVKETLNEDEEEVLLGVQKRNKSEPFLPSYTVFQFAA